MRKQTLACTTECDWSRHLALLSDKACGESFQEHPKSQDRQNSLMHDGIHINKVFVSRLTPYPLDRCYMFTYSTEMTIVCLLPDNGIAGEVDVTIAGCADSSSPGYENAPKGTCKDVTTSYDLEEWGTYMNSTLTSQQGVSCTCHESECNDPQGNL